MLARFVSWIAIFFDDDVFSKNFFFKSRLAWNLTAFISWFKKFFPVTAVFTVNACNAVEKQLDHFEAWALYAYTKAKHHKPIWIIEVFLRLLCFYSFIVKNKDTNW